MASPKRPSSPAIESPSLGDASSQLALLASILESSPDAILTASPDGNITSWNRSAEQIYGYTAGEIVGQPATLLSHPDRLTSWT